SGQEKRVLKNVPGAAAALSPDGTTVALMGPDKRVILWDLAAAKERQSLVGHAGDILCVAFGPARRKILASGSRDGDVIVWDAATGKEVRRFSIPRTPVFGLAFSPNGKTLAAGLADHTVMMWDLESWQEKAVLRGHTLMVHAVAFSSDSKTLASGSDD